MELTQSSLTSTVPKTSSLSRPDGNSAKRISTVKLTRKSGNRNYVPPPFREEGEKDLQRGGVLVYNGAGGLGECVDGWGLFNNIDEVVLTFYSYSIWWNYVVKLAEGSEKI